MSTLDLPQYVYSCRACGAEGADAISCGHELANVGPVPTLTYRDFAEYMTAVSLAVHPMPSDEDVWDRLESQTDTAATNREAIDNAIRAVGREMTRDGGS
jgi:hypothetical protein